MNVELERVRQSDDRRKTLYWRVVIDGEKAGAVREIEPGVWRVTMYPLHRRSYRLPFARNKSAAIAEVMERHQSVTTGARHVCCHNMSPGPHSAHCQFAFAEGLPTEAVCHNCESPLRDGDAAYEQGWREVRTSGTSVNFSTRTVIVCESCAEVVR